MSVNKTPPLKIYSTSFFQAHCSGHACGLRGADMTDTQASLVSISRRTARLLLSTDIPASLRPGDRVLFEPRFKDIESSHADIDSVVADVSNREVTLKFFAELPMTAHRLHRITRR